MGRSTIYFDPDCGMDIEDAISVLDEMMKSQGAAESDEMSQATWIVACSAFVVLTVYQVVNMICYSRRWCREECCCHNRCCFRANKIIYSCINALLGIEMLVFTSIMAGKTLPKYDSLNQWADYSDCVSSFEKISNDETA